MYVRPRPRFRPRNAGSGNMPSLALEFNQLSALPSYVTFSRGTQAMRYGSDGTLQYAPNNLLTYSRAFDNAAWTKSNSFVQTNLLLYSEQFDNAAWGKSLITVTANATIAPDGTLTADRIISAGGAYPQTSQNPTLAAGDYTFSLWVKSDGTPQIAQSLLLDGTPVNFTPTDTWTRVSVTKTGVLAGSRGIVIATNSPTAPASSFYVWGAQLVQGSVPGDYQATTSAAVAVGYTSWDGTLNAKKLCEDNAAAVSHGVFQTATTPAGANTTSVYAKAGERTWAIVGFGGVGTAAYFNLSTGVVGTVSGVTATIVSIGSGWYRLSVTATLAAGSNFPLVRSTTGDNIASNNGDGSSGIYIADAQLTPGYLPLEVTPTTSAAVYGPRFDYDPSTLVTQNLLTYSEQFDNVAWIKTNATVSSNATAAPNGTLTADFVQPGTSSGTQRAYQNVIGILNIPFNFSCYFKAAGYTKVAIREANTTGQYIAYDLSNQTLLSSSGFSGYGAPVITSVGNGWYRISGAMSTASGTAWAFSFHVLSPSYTTGDPASAGNNWAGDGVSGVYIWGAQLNTGSTALTYTATTTAPYTLCAARGLLIEEQRANLLTYSEQFDNSAWQNAAPNFPTVTANAILSPDGTVNADLLTASTGGTVCNSRQVASTGTTGNFTGSVLLKAGTSTRSRVLIADATSGFTVIGDFQIAWAAGVASVFSTASGTASIVASKDGWYRCVISASTASANAIMALTIFPDVVLGTNTVYAYGAQLEAGAFATSYIPTVGSTATRNADSASITTLTPWFNAAAGTIYASGTRISSSAPSGVITEIGDGTSNNRHMIFAGSPTPDSTYLVTTGGVAQVNISVSNGFAGGVLAKAAAAYAVNDFQLATNGTLSSPDISGTLPTVTTLYIGTNSGGSVWDGWIRSIRYYPTRLPNASLQSITV